MIRIGRSSGVVVGAVTSLVSGASAQQVHVGFLWHMHQPIYQPYDSVLVTNGAGVFSFDLVDVHNQRSGPYRDWPLDAVSAGAALAHLGAQVSFSGSLIENLDVLEGAGVAGGLWSGWTSGYAGGAAMQTSMSNPRLDMVAFGYHHPLMPLLDERDLRMQIKLHKLAHQGAWGTAYSRGMFPPETAFHTRMIPALAAEGVQWVLVDNIHFDRACENYPHTNASNLFPPNRADQVNPDPAGGGGAWVQLQNLWAPSPVSVPFGYQPHVVRHVDPWTGTPTDMVAVPAARYEGNEDARGGYGAFLYDVVMDALIPFNTDPLHPVFVVLHHDGDNFGGGSDAYYHSNFQGMVTWVSADPDYDVSTVQDYLDRFPPDPGDVIHVEPGSWAGADNGDPEFKKWMGDPDASGWSPDRNSWAVLTAARNRVFTADDIAPYTSLSNIRAGAGTPTERAWHYLLCSEASDYWYWDGTEVWDSNVTRGCNLAVAQADIVLAGVAGAESTPPSIMLPQREPYNPGALEWGPAPEPTDFEVWTYAYDVSGLVRVELNWRIDADGVNPIATIENETYAGGPGVGAWNVLPMASSDVPAQGGVLAPAYRALRYGATIAGQQDVLIDYFVEAEDGGGTIERSDIQHVWVGSAGGGGGQRVQVSPAVPVAGQDVLVTYDAQGGPLAGAGSVFAHYGFDNWQTVVSPDVVMAGGPGVWSLTVPVPAWASQFDIVFNDGAGTWDNNATLDWHFPVVGADPASFVLDGVLDGAAFPIGANGGVALHGAVDADGVLYLAVDDAGEGRDHFVYLAGAPGPLQPANWLKSGQVGAWDAYLADENDNDFASWFDASGAREAVTGPNGGVLEGTLDLAGEFGSVPGSVYLAFGAFDTPDGGALAPGLQVPSSLDGDGNIDPAEFVEVVLADISIGCVADGDVDASGVVDVNDISFVIFRLGDPGGPGVAADADADGSVTVSDIAYVIFRLGGACP